MARKPNVTHNTILAHTRLFRIEQVGLHFSNGTRVQWERLRSTSPGAEKRAGDEPEPIEVVPWPLDRLNELCALADCTEARSIAALFMVRELLQSEGR